MVGADCTGTDVAAQCQLLTPQALRGQAGLRDNEAHWLLLDMARRECCTASTLGRRSRRYGRWSAGVSVCAWRPVWAGPSGATSPRHSVSIAPSTSTHALYPITASSRDR